MMSGRLCVRKLDCQRGGVTDGVPSNGLQKSKAIGRVPSVLNAVAMQVIALTEQPGCDVSVFGLGAAVASKSIRVPALVPYFPGIAVTAALGANEAAAFLFGSKCAGRDFKQVGCDAHTRDFKGIAGVKAG